jgi:hypothetical protein
VEMRLGHCKNENETQTCAIFSIDVRFSTFSNLSVTGNWGGRRQRGGRRSEKERFREKKGKKRKRNLGSGHYTKKTVHVDLGP